MLVCWVAWINPRVVSCIPALLLLGNWRNDLSNSVMQLTNSLLKRENFLSCMERDCEVLNWEQAVQIGLHKQASIITDISSVKTYLAF
jgi:hypothetical protein